MSNLTPESFEKFVNKFKSRFGEGRMPAEIAADWFNKFCEMDDETFVAVTDELIGTSDRAFGFKHVFDKKALMFPGEDPQKVLEKEWKKNPVSKSNAAKRSEITRLMGSMMTRIKHKGAGLGWVDEFAEEFIRIWGANEARNMLRRLRSNIPEAPVYRKFLEVVTRKLSEVRA